MLPLVPGAIPVSLEGDRIEPELKFAMRVAAQCPVVVEVTFTQWDMEPPAPEIRRKRQDAAGKESLSITGRLAAHEKRPKPTIGNKAGASRSASRSHSRHAVRADRRC